MSRVTGSLIQSAGKRFFFALDTIPGIVAPGVGLVTLSGNVPIAVQPQTVFRTPAPATLTLLGGSLAAPTTVSPAVAAFNTAGLIPSRELILTITPSLANPVENPPPDIVPTIIPIWTTSPGVGFVQFQTLEINITQGGNIGFLSPGVGAISLGTLPYTLLFGNPMDTAVLTVAGLVPTLMGSTEVTPDTAILTALGNQPALALPFVWIDDHPAPVRTWLTDAAA